MAEINKIKLPYDLTVNTLEPLFIENTDSTKGEVSLPCFSLAKNLKLNPAIIATELANTFKSVNTDTFSNVEAVAGYVNFYVNRSLVVNNVIQEILDKQQEYGKQNIGNGKTVFIDFSSVNLAKYMHIGHLKTTMLGWSMYKIFTFLGYKVVRLNYVGDYGTPFGKMITAYKLWGNKQDVLDRGVDAIQDLYVKFNVEAQNNPSLNDQAREWFKKIETGDAEALELFNWFVKTGVEEVERICNVLGVDFDSWRGENYYSNKMEPIVQELKEKELLKQSEGAYVVDLQKFNLGVALIKKSDGTSLYLTRDLAAVKDRYQTYKFDMGLYVTSVQQKLHFEQLFKVVELMGRPYANKLEHLYYGTYSMPSGKIGSRFGKQAIVSDILNVAKERAMDILVTRGTKHDNADEVAEKIAVGALAFEVVKVERNRDSIFDLNKSISFEGETSAYVQYTLARAYSILEKAQDKALKHEISEQFEITDEYFNLAKLLNKFPSAALDSFYQREPYLLTRLVLNICSEFNKFYAYNRIINEGVVVEHNLHLVNAVGVVLENALPLLGLPIINKM